MLARISNRLLPLGLVLAAACGGAGPNGPPAGSLAVAKAAPSGDAQAGVVGQALAAPIRVEVTRDGQPEAGASVAWTATGTGASVSPAQATADAQGIAFTNWTLAQVAGAQTAVATIAGATGSPVTFTATAAAGAAAALSLAGGNGQSATNGEALPNPLQASVDDQFGNGVSGVSVAWAVVGGGGSISPGASTTNAQGVAAATWTVGTTGPQEAQATVAGLTGSPLGFLATATDPAPVGGVTVGNNVFTPAVHTVSAGATVVWTWTNTGVIPHSVESTGSPSFGPNSGTLTGNGQTFSHDFTVPGTYTYECGVHGASMSGSIVVQ